MRKALVFILKYAKPQIRVGLVAFGVLLWASTVGALQPAIDITQYAHTSWSIRDGFLKAAVRAIVQTPDGYLWLGTEFGLVRFDGVRFFPWAPPEGQHLPSSNIRSLFAARDGTLWIGTLEGLASWKDGKLSQYEQFAGQNVLSILEDREGIVWAGAFGVPKGKLCAIRQAQVQCYGEDGSLGQWVWSLYQDDDGHVWAGAQTGLWRWKPGPPKQFRMSHSIETSQAIVQAGNGGRLLAIGEGIWQLKDERMQEYPLATPGGRITPVNMFRDRDGGLWVGTLQRGLLRVYQGKTSLFTRSDGLSSDRVQSMFEDKEGNIWVGTMDGLDRFHENAAVSISVKEGLSSPSVWAVLIAHDNTIWVSTLNGLNRWNDGKHIIYRPGNARDAGRQLAESSLASGDSHRPRVEQAATQVIEVELPDNIGSLYEDERGRIWVSSPLGIARLDGSKFNRLRELPGGWVNAMTADNQGGVWISYQDQGLMHWLDGKAVETVPWSRLGNNGPASVVVPDAKGGGLWLGFFQGGLLHFKDGQIHDSYAKKNGLGGGRVMGLQLDADGTLWAATEGGLSRIRKGQIVTIASRNGLPCDTVHWMVELDGWFWLYTACGLLRVERTALEESIAEPSQTFPYTIFDTTDGVRSHALLTGYTPRVSKSADGKLWFANFQDVTVVDSRHLPINRIAPPVHIEKITADGKSYDPTRGPLPPLVRNLTIDYTALSLVVPEKVHFRFQLEGQDKHWREVVNVREVQYTNLAPKHYRFLVKACNNSGVWNEEGAALDFVIPPAWYQTNWFLALGVAAFLALLWALYQFRLHQLARQFHMSMDTRVAERTRIARDLHDTLLQSFHGILLYLQSGIHLLPERPVEAKKTFEDAVDQAERAIIEGREAVQGLRASTVEGNDLALAIKTLGGELAAADSGSYRPEFSVQMEGTPRNLHPILRDEVYRIAGEAMRNAYRHADAKRIEVEIRYDERQLRVRIRDDGKGVDPKLISDDEREGHFGLRGMRERAKLIGGKLTVWSELDSGTEVELNIPASRAYIAPDEQRSWLAEKFAKFSGKDTELKS